MNIDQPMRDLGAVDSTALSDAVLGLDDDAWLLNVNRQNDYEVHKQTQSIVLVFCDGPINDLQQVFGDAHVIEQQLVRQLDHARAGQVPTIANPVAFSVTAVEYHRAPPVLGQHTNEVLRDLLGYSPEKIAALADDGAI